MSNINPNINTGFNPSAINPAQVTPRVAQSMALGVMLAKAFSPEATSKPESNNRTQQNYGGQAAQGAELGDLLQGMLSLVQAASIPLQSVLKGQKNTSLSKKSASDSAKKKSGIFSIEEEDEDGLALRALAEKEQREQEEDDQEALEDPFHWAVNPNALIDFAIWINALSAPIHKVSKHQIKTNV